MQNQDIKGAPSIVVGVAAMATGDALIKRFATDLPLDSLIAGRSTIALPILIVLYALIWRCCRQSFSIPSRKTATFVAVRSTLLALMWLCYYAALPHISLSLAAALFYSSPIFICSLSILIGMESWSYRRAASVTMGLAGVVIVLGPWDAVSNAYALLPIAAAALYGVAQILTRARLQSVDSSLLAAAMNGGLLIAATVVICSPLTLSPSLRHSDHLNPVLWDPATLLKLIVLAILISVTAKLTARAFQVGLPTIIGIFDYAYLIFATALGWLLFAEIPTIGQWLGILLIVAAGVVLLPTPGRFLICRSLSIRR